MSAPAATSSVFLDGDVDDTDGWKDGRMCFQSAVRVRPSDGRPKVDRATGRVDRRTPRVGANDWAERSTLSTFLNVMRRDAIAHL